MLVLPSIIILTQHDENNDVTILLNNSDPGRSVFYRCEIIPEGEIITVPGIHTTPISTTEWLVSGDILFVNLSSKDTVDSKIKINLENALANEVIIISLNGSALFTNKDLKFGPIAFSNSADMCGLYHEKATGIKHCYSVDADDTGEAMQRMLKWIDKIKSSKSSPIVPPDSIETYADFQCGNRGWLGVRTYYQPLGTDYFNYDYWGVHYCIESSPDNWYQTSELKIVNQVDNPSSPLIGKLMRHSPSTTGGSTAIGVNMSVSNNGISAGISWSYNVPDVSVINNSSVATGYYSIKHVIMQSNSSSNTYYCEPGAIIKCEHGDSDTAYYSTDVYSIKHTRNNATHSNNFSITPILYPDR